MTEASLESLPPSTFNNRLPHRERIDRRLLGHRTLIRTMFLRVFLPNNGPIFGASFLTKPIRQFRQLTFLIFRARVSFRLALFMNLFTTNPFVNFTCHTLRVIAYVRFGQRVLVSRKCVLNHLKGRAIRFLPTRVQGFSTAVIHSHNLVRRFAKVRNIVINKRNATDRANASTLHIVNRRVRRSVNHVQLAHRLRRNGYKSTTFNVNKLTIVNKRKHRAP